MAQVALVLSGKLGASRYPFAMTVAMEALAAFMTPVSSPVNTLVVRPGSYRFIHFLKIGDLLKTVTLIVAVTLVPIVLPF